MIKKAKRDEWGTFLFDKDWDQELKECYREYAITLKSLMIIEDLNSKFEALDKVEQKLEKMIVEFENNKE